MVVALQVVVMVVAILSEGHHAWAWATGWKMAQALRAV